MTDTLPDSRKAVTKTSGSNRYYNGPLSDHFDGTIFFNPGGTPPPGFMSLLRWQFGSGKTAWPAHYPSPHDDHVPDERVEGTALRITMIGHASLLLQTAGLNILFDPVFADRASPVQWFGPKRRNPPGIRFENLPPIDAVLVSHNHYDHLDLAALKRLAREHDPLFVTPLGNDRIIRDAADSTRIVTGDFARTELPPRFDLVVGNPPFSDRTVRSDRALRSLGLRLHDYFIVKAIRLLKPGALAAFVTSHGTMDKADSGAREEIAKHADLIGAIRLPEGSFRADAGTDVVEWRSRPSAPVTLNGREYDCVVNRFKQSWWPHPDGLRGFHGRWGQHVTSDPLARRAGPRFPNYPLMFLQALADGVKPRSHTHPDPDVSSVRYPCSGSVRRQSFSDFSGRFVTEALVRFLFKFRRQRLGAASGGA